MGVLSGLTLISTGSQATLAHWLCSLGEPAVAAVAGSLLPPAPVVAPSCALNMYTQYLQYQTAVTSTLSTKTTFCRHVCKVWLRRSTPWGKSGGKQREACYNNTSRAATWSPE